MRWQQTLNHTYNPMVTRWETKTAEFLQIEISPSHIFRIKIDKNRRSKKGGDPA